MENTKKLHMRTEEKEKGGMLGIIKWLLIIVLAVGLPLGVVEGLDKAEEHKRDSIIECMDEDYRFVVDGVDFDFETIYDLDVFLQNYHLVEQDDTQKVLVFEHNTRSY